MTTVTVGTVVPWLCAVGVFVLGAVLFIFQAVRAQRRRQQLVALLVQSRGELRRKVGSGRRTTSQAFDGAALAN